MTTYTYTLIIFFLASQLIGLGGILQKLGEERKGKYSGVEVFVQFILIILFSISLYLER